MGERSVIVIGAGLAGLSTGCYAQANGYQSRIFEHHSVPGGVAAAWKRKAYLIDGGIHFVMGHKPGTALHELYRQFGVAQADGVVDMTTYARFVDEISGRSVEITQDLERLAGDLKAFSPVDSQVVDELMAGACAMQGSDLSELGMSKPPELTGLRDQAMELWAMRRLFRYFTGKYGRPVADYVQAIHDPALRKCIEDLFMPEVPVYFIFMLLGLLADGQLGLLKDGCVDGFVLPLAERYRNLGGEVTYEATIEEILVEEDKAVGVRLADDSEHRADFVVSAADGYSTIFKMLGGRYLDEKIRNRYANWKLSRPLLTVSYGVAREFPDEPPFVGLSLERPFAVGDQRVDGLFLRILNYSPHFAPAGKTVVQAGYEGQWDYWNELRRQDKARYDAEKQRVAGEILARVEVHYPGISSQVEVTDVATPYTTWRYTLNQKGSWGGWLLTADVITKRVERTLPGLGNFYMAGQWVMPGGGVPSCLYSGRHAVQLLCRQDRKPFTGTLP